MRKEILIITVAAFALNSCGIYTNYKPEIGRAHV